jgi:hypothetical protein
MWGIEYDRTESVTFLCILVSSLVLDQKSYHQPAAEHPAYVAVLHGAKTFFMEYRIHVRLNSLVRIVLRLETGKPGSRFVS